MTDFIDDVLTNLQRELEEQAAHVHELEVQLEETERDLAIAESALDEHNRALRGLVGAAFSRTDGPGWPE